MEGNAVQYSFSTTADGEPTGRASEGGQGGGLGVGGRGRFLRTCRGRP